PYPDEFTRPAALPDGTPIILRPLKPEDEHMWRELIARCSVETIRFRFRYLFKEATHDMARRFVFTDYDREMAIMAEINEGGERKFIGAVRLVADQTGESVEYAALVEDAWQGRGVGGVLTDYGLEVAQRWGFKRVTAETTHDNVRMLHALQKRGFHMVKSEGSEVLYNKTF
ncbi:MAG: GNAT family N-acetyltransferase, partial [Anaerolineales bacterium]|nr:GNAT family N-acetyltransferase [Anaerolineales bacterium]